MDSWKTPERKARDEARRAAGLVPQHFAKTVSTTRPTGAKQPKNRVPQKSASAAAVFSAAQQGGENLTEILLQGGPRAFQSDPVPAPRSPSPMSVVAPESPPAVASFQAQPRGDFKDEEIAHWRKMFQEQQSSNMKQAKAFEAKMKHHQENTRMFCENLQVESQQREDAIVAEVLKLRKQLALREKGSVSNNHRIYAAQHELADLGKHTAELSQICHDQKAKLVHSDHEIRQLRDKSNRDEITIQQMQHQLNAANDQLQQFGAQPAPGAFVSTAASLNRQQYSTERMVPANMEPPADLTHPQKLSWQQKKPDKNIFQKSNV